MPSHIRFVTPAIALAFTTAALAGPLNPPAGPITSTQKPLSEVEPRVVINAINTPGDADSLFKITQPGAYYLTGNITGVAAKHGVEIASSGVSIDLNGFELTGVVGSLRGVVTSGALTNVEVKNGSIRFWSQFGIDFNTALTVGAAIRDLRVSNCGNTGISVASGSVIIGCATSNNGVNGINTLSGCLVAHCVAISNGADGIELNGPGTVDACVSSLNGSDGFEIGSGITLTACTALDNERAGFNLGTNCTITGCSAFSNDANGIESGAGSLISNNTSRSNGVDGIFASSSCLILANACLGNGLDAATGAGIHVNGGDNRIEGNNCTGQDRGIDIDAAGNFIVRNTCANNTTNWDIVANNVFGPIINRTTPASPAVTGDAAASSLSSTDANANYTF